MKDKKLLQRRKDLLKELFVLQLWVDVIVVVFVLLLLSRRKKTTSDGGEDEGKPRR
jgi:hypothetical protein